MQLTGDRIPIGRASKGTSIHPAAIALALAVHLAASFAILATARRHAPPPAVTRNPLTLTFVTPAPRATPVPAVPPPEPARLEPPPEAQPAPLETMPPAAATPIAPAPLPPPVPSVPAPRPAAAAVQPPPPVPRPSRAAEAPRAKPPAAQTISPPAPTQTKTAAPPPPLAAPPVSAPPLSSSTQPPAAPPSPPTSDPAWAGALSSWLDNHRAYPELARRRGEQGAVGVRFTVLRDGRVQTASVVRPSGSDALDQAALAMLQNARVPEFPPSMPQPSTTVTVTIRFTLAR